MFYIENKILSFTYNIYCIYIYKIQNCYYFKVASFSIKIDIKEILGVQSNVLFANTCHMQHHIIHLVPVTITSYRLTFGEEAISYTVCCND